MATDFIYEDLESRSIYDDTFVMAGMGKVDNHSCIIIFSTPIKKSSYWGKKIFVDEHLLQIRKIEFFSEESVLDKTLFSTIILTSCSFAYKRNSQQGKLLVTYCIRDAQV